MVIKVKNMSGKLLGGYESFLVKKNRTIVKTLYCPLPAGHYRFSVIAGDGAGNVTRVPSTSSLTMGSMAGLTAETPSGPRFMPAAPSASDLRSLLRMHLR